MILHARLLLVSHGLRKQLSRLLVTPAGKAKYDPKRSGIVWKIKRFNGRQEHTLHASVALITTTRERQTWARPPLQMQFQVCAAASGPDQLLCARVNDNCSPHQISTDCNTPSPQNLIALQCSHPRSALHLPIRFGCCQIRCPLMQLCQLALRC